MAAAAWNPNAETDVARYLVSYGTSPGDHPITIDAGLDTSATLAGLQEGTTYYVVVTAVNSQGLHSQPSAEIVYQVPPAATPPAGEIPQSGWSLQYVDSEEGGNYAATMAFDGNPHTFWHTAWTSGATPPPHEIRVDLGVERPVNGFRYLPRQDGVSAGNIAPYEFLVSVDGINWGPPVASGNFAPTGAEKEVFFTTRNARYVMLRSFGDANGGNDCNIAELNILQDISVQPLPNQSPVADGKSIVTAEDAAAVVTLSGSDPDGDSLAYHVVAGPVKGTLAGTPPNLTYTPAADASGSDSFTYKVSDGSLDSNIATVSVTVSPVNDAPVAVSKAVSTNEDTPVSIVLSASDKEGGSLTYSVVTGPANGILSGTLPNLTYTPSKDFNGTDSVTYKANDGTANSGTATVSINVTEVIDKEVIPRSGWTLRYVDSEDQSGTPAAYAFDGNPNTFWHTRWQSGATPPPHEIQIDLGKVHVIEGFRYLPRQDGFTVGGIARYEFYTSLDGVNWGTPAATGTFSSSTIEKEVIVPTVSTRYIRLRSMSEINGAMHTSVAELNVLGTVASNQPPVAGSENLRTAKDKPLAVALSANDPENDPVTFSFVVGPANGTLSGTAPDLTYTPAPGYTGADSFAFQANDGVLTSNIAIVSIFIAPQETPGSNKPPVFKSNPLDFGSAYEGEACRGETLAVTATDPDKGDSITFSKVSGPGWLEVSANGKLSGTPPAGSKGVSRFIVRATDKEGAFAESVLLIEIKSAGIPLPWEMEPLGESGGKPAAAHRAGTYKLRGAGTLSGSADAACFLWQKLGGDGSITARVADIEDGGKFTRAGVMIRDSLAPNSQNVFIGVNGKGDFRWTRRTRKGHPSITKAGGKGSISPSWVRLVRKDDTIIAYRSADGEDWKRVGATTVEVGRHCYIGLSTSGGKGKTATASFKNVKVEQ